MPSQILLATHINAPVERVFDLARNIDVHVESTKHTSEQAIAGRTSGLIELGETVTWRAKHFGTWQTLSSKITEMKYPNYFTDIQVEGAFKSFTHEHYFYPILNQTMMRDIFTFESPGGLLGDAVNCLFLSNYMTRLLLKRNGVIKALAEAPSLLKGVPFNSYRGLPVRGNHYVSFLLAEAMLNHGLKARGS